MATLGSFAEQAAIAIEQAHNQGDLTRLVQELLAGDGAIPDDQRAGLQRRTAEPWFDPAGLLLHEVDGQLAGFCWTKVHADERPPLGEIFVIAVDPAFAGRNLGRQLVLAGLDHLAHEGLRDAILYVEATNTRARALYDDLGFATVATDRWWRRPLHP